MAVPRKIVIIGAGHVGSMCGYALMLRGEADELVYIDIAQKKAACQALALADACAWLPHPPIDRMGNYSDCRDADLVILAIGVPRKPGQTRLDLFDDSMRSAQTIVEPLNRSGFDGIFISITNPADVVCDFVRKRIRLPKNRIFSTGTALDTARLRQVLSAETGIAPASIQAFVLGEHGDSQMVPLSHITVGGRALPDLMREKPDRFGKLDLNRIVATARQKGTDIIEGKGATEFGIGYTLSEIVSAIFHDQRRILPVSPLLEGEYGQSGVHAGVPCVIGKNGVEEIVELSLTPEENAAFNRSCDVIRAFIQKADLR
jgi:L-lactate dehydrogenase